MAIPKSVIESIQKAGRRARAEQREELALRPKKDVNAQREKARISRAIWRWLGSDDVRRLKEESGRAGLQRLVLLGPVVAQTGKGLDRLRSGSLILSLIPGEEGLHLNYRFGPAWGASQQLTSLASMERRVPLASLARLLSLIESNEIWAHVGR